MPRGVFRDEAAHRPIEQVRATHLRRGASASEAIRSRPPLLKQPTTPARLASPVSSSWSGATVVLALGAHCCDQHPVRFEARHASSNRQRLGPCSRPQNTGLPGTAASGDHRNAKRRLAGDLGWPNRWNGLPAVSSRAPQPPYRPSWRRARPWASQILLSCRARSGAPSRRRVRLPAGSRWQRSRARS